MSKEVAKRGSYTLAALEGAGCGLSPEEIAEELGGESPKYPQVKIPSGGGLAFEVPGDDPNNPDVAKQLEGVVVWHHACNAYWESRDTTNTPPDCASIDGKTGYYKGCPVACKDCAMNQFGSGEGGKGKACKNMKRLYILTGDSLFPYALTLPPTSIRAWTDYVSSILQRGRKACDVVTRVSLAKKENTSGQPYSVAVFANAGGLDGAVRDKSRAYRETIRAFVSAGHDVAQELTTPTQESACGGLRNAAPVADDPF